MRQTKFGNHMGFAVLPARPRTPRDKGAAETAIGITSVAVKNSV